MNKTINKQIVSEQSLSKQYRIVDEDGEPVLDGAKWHDSLAEAINELNSLLYDNIHQLHRSNDYDELTDAL